MLPVLAIFGLGWGLGFSASKTATPGRLLRDAMGKLGIAAAAGPTQPGHWGRAAPLEVTGHMTPEIAREVKRLQSLGYAGGTLPAAGGAGVTVHETGTASPGLRFFLSGHEPGASLIDAEGQLWHHWRFSYEDCRSGSPLDPDDFLPDPQKVTACWRRARLLPGGEVLAIFEGHGLVKIDRDSRLIWSYPGPCHHDLDLAPDGSIFVLTRRPRVLPRYDRQHPLLLDSITHLSPDGVELGSLDLLEAFENSLYAPFLKNMKTPGDVFHTNTIERFDGHLAGLSPCSRRGIS